MQRMSEPQIVVLFVRTRTSPWPGVGTSKVRSSTVLFPGRTAPSICVGIRPIEPSWCAPARGAPGDGESERPAASLFSMMAARNGGNWHMRLLAPRLP